MSTKKRPAAKSAPSTKPAAKKAVAVSTQTTLWETATSTNTLGATNAASYEVVRLQPGEYEPWPGLNPRRKLDTEKFKDLVQSIKERGVLQPVLVHDRSKDGTVAKGQPRYWIVSGETRGKAVKAVAGAVLPAVVRKFTAAEAMRIVMIENLQRNDLTPLEEARGFKNILDSDENLTQQKLAKELGVSQEHLSNRVRLLELPDIITQYIDGGEIAPTVARDYLLPFAHLPEPALTKCFKYLADEVKDYLKRQEAQTVRGADVQKWIAISARANSKPIAVKDGVTPVFDPKLHDKECKCGAPQFKYMEYEKPHRRCFNLKWWDGAQAKARRERDKERKIENAKASKTVKGAKVKDSEFVDAAKLHKEFGYDYPNMHLGAVLVDVAKLEGVTFMKAKDRNDKTVFYTSTRKELEAAMTPVQEQGQKLLVSIAKERTRADIAEADATPFATWMLREYMTSQHERIDELLEEFGVVKEQTDYQKVIKLARSLPDDVAERVFKVVALRAKRGDYNGNIHWKNDNPVHKAAVAVLEKQYGPGRDALIAKLSGKKLKVTAAQPAAEKPRVGGPAKKNGKQPAAKKPAAKAAPKGKGSSSSAPADGAVKPPTDSERNTVEQPVAAAPDAAIA